MSSTELARTTGHDEECDPLAASIKAKRRDSDLIEAEARFRFGENWTDYLRHIDTEAIEEAERGLLALIPAERLKGATFLDIGCGSGIHALAAHRLGARVTAIDIDPDSVAATSKLLQQHGVQGDVRHQSVFEASGKFDIVYSWGVLHHTGAMWKAIKHAAALVKPGGLFTIAIYQQTPLCGFWRNEKKFYSKSPKLVQRMIRGLYVTYSCALHVYFGTNPIRFIRGYKSRRGMNYFTDIHDWLGGYPYESADPDELVSFVARLGFSPVVKRPLPKSKGIRAAGCGEFTFERRKVAQTSR